MSKYDFSQNFAREKSWKWEYESRVDGYPVLPMSVADTDFISPREVTETFRQIVDNGQFGYSTYPEDQHEVLASWQRRRHSWEVEPEDIVITNGLLSTLVLMLDAVTAPGDGVIVFTPVYHNFFDTIAGAGRIPVSCELLLDPSSGWALDFDAFEALCQPADTRAVVICNPHNPVGRAWREAELRRLVEIAQAHELTVFSDEIHADYVFEQAFCPTLKAAADKGGIMTLSSGGKIFNLGGLFTSFAITRDPGLKATLKQALGRLMWEQNTFAAWGSYSAFKHGYDYRDQLVSYIRKMQVKMVDALNAMPFPVSASLPEATYLLWVDFRATGWNPDQIHRFLVTEAGLGFNRGDLYGKGGDGFVRINCAAPEQRIDEAIARLTAAFEKRYPPGATSR